MSENNFIPLTASHGNVDGDIANLRNIFVSAEMDYFEGLMKVDKNRELFLDLLDYPPDGLYKEAMKRINMVESGMVKENELDVVEAQITFLLAAIQDKVKLLELVKIRNLDSKERSR